MQVHCFLFLLEFFIIKPISSLFLCSCVMDESMLTFHVGQLSWYFLSQVGPCHQNSFPFRILTVQPLDAISTGFWVVDTYRNSTPLFDWISSILLWTNGVRIFFDFNHCNKHCESVHKVFRWILSCKFCVMKLMLLVAIKTGSSSSLWCNPWFAEYKIVYCLTILSAS